MKMLSIAILFLVSLSIDSFAGIEQSTKEFCNFTRIIKNSDVTLQEEFAMLLESRWTPHYQAITEAIAILAITPPEDLNNPECSIYKYTRELLDYYNKNKEKITEDKLYIMKLLDAIQKRVEEAAAPKTKPHKWWIF